MNMKKAIKYLVFALLVGNAFAACETYHVDDPDMTAIAGMDGKYAAFAFEDNGTDTTTIFGIQITNTTKNESDRAWVTITDMDTHLTGSDNYLDAIRFEVSVDMATRTFSAKNVKATEPNTCWNPYREGWYGSGNRYTYAYQNKVFKDYTVSLEGKVTPDGVNTKTGYKTDAIEFTYTRMWPDNTSKTYTVRGMRKTGWAEDMTDYENFANDNLL